MATFPKDPKVKSLLGSALRYLSYRSRSQFEVKQYLLKKTNHDPEITDLVCQQLSQFNLLNDLEFTQQYIQYRLKQGKGPLLISHELKQKGLDLKIINDSLGCISFEAWVDSAQNLLRKKLAKTGSIDQAQKAKIYRYLTQRGFTSQVIYSVIDAMGNQ